jgi:uncharacterized repeat protein (TIGR03803 family)
MTIIYQFCPQGHVCPNGAVSYAPLMLDGAGNLYGTTYQGGSSNEGVVFALSPTGGGWTESVLYSFCAYASCADGRNPSAGLVMDSAGTLYGTTWGGGTGTEPVGVAFSLGAGNSLTVSETGNGRVTSSPTGIDCPGSCGASFAPGTQVTLTASASSGATFSGWGGACSGTGSCLVTMNASQSVTATFSTDYVLAASVIGSPGGKVTSSPSGIDCGSTCSAAFAPGAQVTLTAIPAAAWGFAGWSGACSGIASSCTVTLNANASVAASFATLFGIGAGPVVASPADPAALLPPIIAPIPQ